VIAPPVQAIAKAVEMAMQSPCAKSRRGAVVFDPSMGSLISGGWNAPPSGRECDGSKACRESCARRCLHAEATALRWVYLLAMRGDRSEVAAVKRLELVHVKVVDGLVAGGGPSCASCSMDILNSGIAAVWLFQTMPEEWCPHLDMLRKKCPLCQGEACDLCHPGPGRPHCDHDVLDRHHGHPIIDARWRRYTAVEFDRISRRNDKRGPVY
jgi:deoxycytidylate deaminase